MSADPLAGVPHDQFRIASYSSVYFVKHPSPAPVCKLHEWYTEQWASISAGC